MALLRRPFGSGPLRAALGGRPSGGAALWGCASGASGGTRPRPCARRFLWGGASGWCERRKGHGCAHSRRVFFGAVLEVLGGCCVHVHSGPFETCTQPAAYSHGHAFGGPFLGALIRREQHEGDTATATANKYLLNITARQHAST